LGDKKQNGIRGGYDTNPFKSMSKHILRLEKLFRNIKIQSRLLLLFFILSLIPLLITSIFSYRSSSYAMRAKISTYSVQVMDQVRENIQREIQRLENDSVDIEFSDLVQHVLLNYGKMSLWQISNTQYSMKEMLVKKFSFLHDVSDVLLYTNNKDKIIAYGDYGFEFKLKMDFLNSYLKELYENGGKPIWIPISKENEEYMVNFATEVAVLNKDNGMLIGRAVKSLNDGEIMGSLIIRINEKYFSNIYKNIDIGKDADIFIINSRGLVVSSRNPEIQINKSYKEDMLIKSIIKNHLYGKRVFDLKMDKHRFLVTFAPIEGTDWYVVSTTPYSYLNSESEKIGINILLLSLACLVLAVILSFMFSKSISMPLKRLIISMNEVKKGNLSISIKDDSKDEIGEVTQNFNIMLDEIKLLMNDVKYKERQKRDAELKALQAQINPHFLSNTLNTVKWLAGLQNADNIENIVTSLINLLHANMGKDNILVCIREELEYVKNYVNLQEYRYYNKFKVKYEIEERILDYKIPKFTLQPIVENSLIHGIGPMEGQGVVAIKGFVYDGVVKITITDNGVGIHEDKLAKILNSEGVKNKSSFSGIGIFNVNERIKMYFGEQYGLDIQSVQNLFTTVEITIPIII
jgi:two-component system sensor histidine kinase YesM